MLSLLTFIFEAVVLALLITFFVLFLIITASMKKKMTGADEKIEKLQQELRASQTANKDALTRLETETQRINAETAAHIKQKYDEYSQALRASQQESKDALAKLEIATQRINAETAELIKQMHKDFQQDSMNLKVELNGHVDNILKEIKAPLI